MGVVLSLLVVAVGVIEALSCYHHFQIGLLRVNPNITDTSRRRSLFTSFRRQKRKAVGHAPPVNEETRQLTLEERRQIKRVAKSLELHLLQLQQQYLQLQLQLAKSQDAAKKKEQTQAIVDKYFQKPPRPTRSISLPEQYLSNKDDNSILIDELAKDHYGSIKEFDELYEETKRDLALKKRFIEKRPSITEIFVTTENAATKNNASIRNFASEVLVKSDLLVSVCDEFKAASSDDSHKLSDHHLLSLDLVHKVNLNQQSEADNHSTNSVDEDPKVNDITWMPAGGNNEIIGDLSDQNVYKIKNSNTGDKSIVLDITSLSVAESNPLESLQTENIEIFNEIKSHECPKLLNSSEAVVPNSIDYKVQTRSDILAESKAFEYKNNEIIESEVINKISDNFPTADSNSTVSTILSCGNSNINLSPTIESSNIPYSINKELIDLTALECTTVTQPSLNASDEQYFNIAEGINDNISDKSLQTTVLITPNSSSKSDHFAEEINDNISGESLKSTVLPTANYSLKSDPLSEETLKVPQKDSNSYMPESDNLLVPTELLKIIPDNKILSDSLQRDESVPNDQTHGVLEEENKLINQEIQFLGSSAFESLIKSTPENILESIGINNTLVLNTANNVNNIPKKSIEPQPLEDNINQFNRMKNENESKIIDGQLTAIKINELSDETMNLEPTDNFKENLVSSSYEEKKVNETELIPSLSLSEEKDPAGKIGEDSSNIQLKKENGPILLMNKEIGSAEKKTAGFPVSCSSYPQQSHNEGTSTANIETTIIECQKTGIDGTTIDQNKSNEQKSEDFKESNEAISYSSPGDNSKIMRKTDSEGIDLFSLPNDVNLSCMKASELTNNTEHSKVDSAVVKYVEKKMCVSQEEIGSNGENVLPSTPHSTSNSQLAPQQPKAPDQEAFWLIFSGEYTKAMSKDWHSGHFSCWQCDEPLTGQRYVLRDEHPYCIKCYESVFANICEECNKKIGIDSKDLSYKDKHWHEACFLCNKCRVSLVDKQFGSKAEKIYCGNCYDTQFASHCDGCGEIFRAGTKKMEYKTRQWHEKCFCCCVCKTPIGTKSFIPREQEIYCSGCYEEKFATRCVKCKHIITSGGVTYKNEPWHRDCFTCSNCTTSLAGQRFTSRDEKPYCAECFGELFAKKCTSCSRPITGIGGTRFISFEDRHWHNDCFICAECRTSLVGRGFITNDADIICPECAKQKLM